jgi:hypothetical protein
MHTLTLLLLCEPVPCTYLSARAVCRIICRTFAARLPYLSARVQFAEMAQYFTAASIYLAQFPELVAISHVNLQIDNAWFWRKSGGEGVSPRERLEPNASQVGAERLL